MSCETLDPLFEELIDHLSANLSPIQDATSPLAMVIYARYDLLDMFAHQEGWGVTYPLREFEVYPRRLGQSTQSWQDLLDRCTSNVEEFDRFYPIGPWLYDQRRQTTCRWSDIMRLQQLCLIIGWQKNFQTVEGEDTALPRLLAYRHKTQLVQCLQEHTYTDQIDRWLMGFEEEIRLYLEFPQKRKPTLLYRSYHHHLPSLMNIIAEKDLLLAWLGMSGLILYLCVMHHKLDVLRHALPPSEVPTAPILVSTLRALMKALSHGC